MEHNCEHRVRSNRSLFPGRCFVHMGCCRIKTICQSSLREREERYNLGDCATPRPPGPQPMSTDYPFSLSSSSLASPPRWPCLLQYQPRRRCATVGEGVHSNSLMHGPEGPTHIGTPATQKPLWGNRSALLPGTGETRQSQPCSTIWSSLISSQRSPWENRAPYCLPHLSP